MSAFTYPGVYIEELASGVHTITGVATSIGAFVGWAPQGPVTEAVLVQSWSDYASQFGGLDSRSKLGYAVNQFFGNGGQQAYIVRLVLNSTTALATGIGYATTQITASLGAVSGVISLGVGTPVLQSIAITPAVMPPMPIGATVALVATPTYSDGGQSPALAGVNWTTTDATVLSVSAGGVATAVGAGTATLTAISGSISGSTAITVTAANFSAPLAVTPLTPSVAVGQTVQLSANARYTDGTTRDVTASVAWSSNTPADATVGAVGSGSIPPGLVSGLATGAPQIIATIPWELAGVSPTASVGVTVNIAAVVSVAVYPASPTLQTTETQQFNVWGIFSSVTPNPSPIELAQGAPWNWAWMSSNMQVATVDATGFVTAVGAGTTTITANSTNGPFTASTTLTVTAATLNTITLTPPAVSVAVGLSQQLKATGIYSDGTSADLSGSVAWNPSPAGDVTITPGGLVTGVVAGTPTISATWQTVNSSAPVTVTVTPKIPQAIVVTAAATSVSTGHPLQLTATATYSDLTTANVSSSAVWASSPPNLVSVTNTGLASTVAAGGSLTLFASNPGAWGNNLRVSLTVQSPPNSSRFNILVQQVTTSGQLQTLESFVNLSVTPSDPQYVVTVIDNDSNYISFIDPGTGLPVAPAATPSATPPLTPIALGGGADGAVLVPATDQNFELALTSNPTGGVFLLDRVDIFNLLCVPGETDAPTISTLQEYCNKKRAFFIVDAPQLSTTAGLINTGPVGSTPGSITTGAPATNSAYYFPWILAPDPLTGNRPTLFPPCGFVAGIYAATDATRGVWKAPAGIDAGLSGDSGLQYNLTDLENGSLNIQAVNCLRHFKVYGDVVWGSRTLAGNDQAGSEWKYIPIRRLALFLESSLYDGTQWVVFEPNDETLWGQVRLNVGTFMQGLFLQGAFAGTTPQQAYFVKCDAENNPPASVALGIVNILVGFAPLYPAEFVVIQIQQIAQTS